MKKIAIAITLLLALTACQETLEERCAREAREYTEKKCPALVSEEITVDSLVFYPETHTLHYYYTLGGILDNEDALKKHDLKSMLLRELKNSTAMKLYKEEGYNFGYTYYSKQNGKTLFSVTFKKKDYR